MRTILLVFAIAFIALPLSAQQEAAPPAVQKDAGKNPVQNQDKDQVPDKDQGKVPVFRKNVTVVNVLFTVKDKHGALIPNLAKDNFELFEDGKPQTIKYFSTENDVPITLGLLIDSSKSMERTLPEEKVVAGGFLQKVLTNRGPGFCDQL